MVKYSELKEFYDMQQVYLNKESFGIFLKNFAKYRQLYLCAFKGKELVGIAYPGALRDGLLYLKGICVDLAKGYARKGIGSKLLNAFEKKVRDRGQRTLTVGSAKDPKVENFYARNGYQPIEFVVKNRRRRIRIKISDKNKLKFLRKKFKTTDYFIIFEKRL
ncbi:MAG: GNAT family N-acetyltransferase [Candidatus Marsarchaeota archaeon]|nr:GNAT family N-acetyltransferase [Candidatus Marsarchaeota archaeon]MCL5418835.1 GNAT family N-acetyltransferase [Candidatus Marsarchaeota archaeon]